MVTIGFPTKFEAEDFLARIESPVRSGPAELECVTGTVAGTEVAVGIIGMGAELSARRTRKLLELHPAGVFVLAGFAGALNPHLQKGQILIAQGYSSDDLINFIKLIPGFDLALLHTSATVIGTAAEKARAAESTGCQFVDMEASAVARVVQDAGSEIIVVRAISDTATEDLPVDLLSKGYDYARGQTTPVRMALHLMLRPGQIRQLKAFLEPLPAVRKQLSDFLVELVPDLP